MPARVSKRVEAREWGRNLVLFDLCAFRNEDFRLVLREYDKRVADLDVERLHCRTIQP